MGDMTLDLNQSPTNINFNFNVSFGDRWISNGHMAVKFSGRWIKIFKNIYRVALGGAEQREGGVLELQFSPASRPEFPSQLTVASWSV